MRSDWLAAVLDAAAEYARGAGSTAIEASDLLLALASDTGSVAGQLLASAGLDAEGVQSALDAELERSLGVVGVSAGSYDLRATPSPDRPSRVGASAKAAMTRGFSAVRRKGDLRPEHLLLGILSAQLGTVPRALELAGVDRAALVARVRESLPRAARS